MECENGTVICDKCGSQDVSVEVRYDRYIIAGESVIERWDVNDVGGSLHAERDGDLEDVAAQDIIPDFEADGTDGDTYTYTVTCDSCGEVLDEGEGRPQF